MKKVTLSCLGALVGLMMFSSNAFAKCGDVTIGAMNWASGQVVAEAAKFLIENGYGCNVTLVPTSTVPSMTSLAENNEPDIVPELWVNSAPVYSKLESEGKAVTASNIFSNGGQEGWWVPEYLVKKHPQLKTIEGILKNPELVGGKFHNCPEGWACRLANDTFVKAYGFEKSGMEVFNHGSGETLKTSLAVAYGDKKPWFGYYWGPTAILGKYAMVKVDVGPVDREAFDCAVLNDGCPNPRKTDYPASLVVNVVTTSFAKQEPEVYDFMTQFTFPNDVMSKVLAWKESSQSSAQEAAVYFLTHYKKVWKDWLNADASAKLSKIL